VQHALEHGADADDELQVIRTGGAGEYRRRSIVLDVDDELPVAGSLRMRVSQVAEQPLAFAREVLELRQHGVTVRDLLAQHCPFRVAAADESCLLHADPIITGLLHRGRAVNLSRLLGACVWRRLNRSRSLGRRRGFRRMRDRRATNRAKDIAAERSESDQD